MGEVRGVWRLIEIFLLESKDFSFFFFLGVGKKFEENL